MKQGATPLDLLSEVAAGNRSNRELPQPNSRSRSTEESIYSNMRQWMNSKTPPTATPGLSSLSNRESPFPFGRTTSTQPDQPPTTWSSAPSFSSNFPGSTNNHLSTGGFFPSYTPSDPSQGYTSMGSSTAGTYDASPMGMPLTQPMSMTPEGIDAAFDADYLFAMGTMMDEGLLTFPLGFDGNFQF